VNLNFDSKLLLKCDELGRSFVHFLNPDYKLDLIEQLDPKIIVGEKCVAVPFIDYGFSGSFFERVSVLYEEHGGQIYVINTQHFVEKEIPSDHNDIWSGSYQIDSSLFGAIAQDACFSAERVIESEDGKIILFSFFTDFCIFVMPRLDYDMKIAPFVSSPFEELQKRYSVEELRSPEMLWVQSILLRFQECWV
jgi:hypothetical protein